MAEIETNKKIEFVYASNNVLVELKQELEKRFMYQKILVIDDAYCFCGKMDNLMQSIKCEFVVVRKLDNIDWEKFACVVVVNDNMIADVKKLCTQKNKSYVVLLTKLVDASVLCGQYYHKNKILQGNLPLGVVLDKTEIFNKKQFVCNFVLQFCSYAFDQFQQKLDTLFFDAVNHAGMVQSHLILPEKFFALKDIEQLFEMSCQYYLLMCLNKSERLSLNDRLFCMTEFFDGKKQNLQLKFLLQLVLAKLIFGFFVHWNKKLKSTIDLQKHSKMAEQYNVLCSYKTQMVSQQKVDFLLQEFRQKLIDYSKDHQNFVQKAKDFVAEIDVGFLYQTYNAKTTTKITDLICLEPHLFGIQSILSIISDCGLLNFDF